ncbi:MAG: hypothetical protein A2X12_09330 [Bacteroidetes bacterium GWE2_29_8]|nr:MAG: hypothetical protein A2X12_09330 [Bacteroidetes bacterium GWE2_29_8]OFY16196.1 MAG: hypothetical protein A2X02_04255 [Bacteroidetes bacterium GWF2_29_10]
MDLQEKLFDRHKIGIYRHLLNNQSGIDYFSNDYLGFARNQEIILGIEKLKDKYQLTQFGSTGSRLISGNNIIMEDAEQFVSNYHNAKTGLIYNSGLDANIGIFSSIPQKGDVVIYDEEIHASVKLGIRLSFADKKMFKHNDLIDLEKQLNKTTLGDKIVAIESIYSISGDISPLKEIVKLCKKYNAYLIVDEAHSTGIFGHKGIGLVADLGLEKDVFIRLHTFGKAMGVSGAIVLSDLLVKEYLINFSYSFIYTTAMPLFNYIAIMSAYNLLERSEETINNLHNNIKFFNKLALQNNISKTEGRSPIKTVHTNSNINTDSLQKKIIDNGFLVKGIKSPTVKIGNECLRIIIHSFNNNNEIEKLVQLISDRSS